MCNVARYPFKPLLKRKWQTSKHIYCIQVIEIHEDLVAVANDVIYIYLCVEVSTVSQS